MKKITALLFALFIMLSPIQQVHAAAGTAVLYGPYQILAGQQFTVTFGVANVSRMITIGANLTYDITKLDLVSVAAVNSATEAVQMTGGRIFADFDPANGRSGTFNFAVMTFRAKAAFVAGQTSFVEVNTMEYSDGVSDFNPAPYRINIKMVSDNTYLRAITVSQGALNFNRTTTDYVVVVENTVTSINLGASVEDGRSTVSGTGTKALVEYSNIFSLVVRAENGATRTYTVNVQRKDVNGLASPPSTNNFLKEIKLTGYDAFNTAFVKETLDYTLEVGNLITIVEMTATAEDVKSKVEVTQAPLVVGKNIFSIKVTAENGDIKTYTITINRSSDIPTVDEADIIAALSSVTTPSIGLNAPITGEISTEILSALKTSGKTLIVVAKEDDETLYEWLIDGSKLIDTKPIKTKLSFSSLDEDKIKILTNYAAGIVLDFEENLSLPENTILRLSVSSLYKDGDVVTLYYYDSTKNKLTVSTKDLLVKNGKIEFPLLHTSSYFLSQTQLKTLGFMDYIVVLVSIIEACIIVILLFSKRKRRKPKSALPEN